LSDQLALQRTRLANERTLLTYVRTSLALVGFGLALLQFHPERGGRLGYTALAVAGAVLAVGLWRFRVHHRQLAACQLPDRFVAHEQQRGHRQANERAGQE
jgi:putative membrane protein